MTKLEQYRKKRQEEFRNEFSHIFDHGYAVHEGEEGENIVSFISETEEGMIEIFRGLVGEDMPDWDDDSDTLNHGKIYIDQERQRIRKQLPSKIN